MRTHVFVPEVLLCDPLNLRGRNRVDGLLKLLGRHATAARDKLPADILRDRGRAVEAKEQARLELTLCALDFNIRRADGHAGPLLEGEVNEVVEVDGVLGDEVDAPETSVGVRG